MIWASNEGHTFLVTLLLDHGANVNVRGSHGGKTALAWAQFNGNEEVAKLLVAKGAIPNPTPISTPISSPNPKVEIKKEEQKSQFNGHEKVAKLLVAKGAIPDPTPIGTPTGSPNPKVEIKKEEQEPKDEPRAAATKPLAATAERDRSGSGGEPVLQYALIGAAVVAVLAFAVYQLQRRR